MGKQKKTIAQVKNELAKQYNVPKVYGWSGYADDEKEKPLNDLIEKIAKEQNFIPSYLYTIAVGEGLGDVYVSPEYNYNKDPKTNKLSLKIDQEIRGFSVLGVDDFSDDFPRVKKYLPSDYNEGDEFVSQFESRKGEWGRQGVNSAIFKNLESALLGYSAVLAHRRDLFKAHAKELAYSTPTEDQLAYWTYCYYQGEGRAKKYLKSNKSLDFTLPAPAEMKGVKLKALERVATWRYVQFRNVFSS